MIKIATWNVNSIRARIVNFLEWINIHRPEVILIQELKCTENEFPRIELECLGYDIKVLGQKGKNGVAILSKIPLENVEHNLPLYGIVESDSDSRYLEARFSYNGKMIKVASIYLPNGGPTAEDARNNIKDALSTDSFKRKMKFCDRLKIKFQESIDNNEMAFFCGDYNVCPDLYKDVWTPKKDGAITCTKEEREKFKSFLDIGMIDVWRNLNPDLIDYSWWGYRPHYMWEKNLGYRLDAILATQQAKNLVKRCDIYAKETRGKDKASDHVPMMCEIEI